MSRRYENAEVRAAATALHQTLDRMGQALDRHCEPLPHYVLKVRIPAEAERGIAAYMNRRGIFNQAEAARQIIAAGLAALGKQESAA